MTDKPHTPTDWRATMSEWIPEEWRFPGRTSGTATYCGNCYSIMHTSNQCDDQGDDDAQ